MPYRSPRVASAIRVTISTSDFRCGLAGSQRSAGGVHRAGRVLHRDPLRAAEPGRPSRCGPWSAGSARSRPQTRCERLSLVEMCTVSRARRIASATTLGVRRGLHEVAAEAEEDVRLAVPQRADRIDGVQPVLAGRVEPELASAARPGSAAAAAPRCPSCGRPARWSGRAPGTARRPACRCCPGRRPGCRPP